MCETIWHLYILRLANGNLYTGITTNIERRIGEHRDGKGARYLRGKGKLELVFKQQVGDHSTALKTEHRIKKLIKREKERLIRGELTIADIMEPKAHFDTSTVTH